MKALIAAGPVLFDEAPELLTSSNLADLEGRWECEVLERYLRELGPKRDNAAEVLERIEKLHSNQGRLLDVGCFCGVFLSVAAARGWDCYGLEPLVGPSIYARAKFGLRVLTDTLRVDSFEADFFDVVTSFQVFEHLIEPDVECAKLARMLRPGGLLVVEVPNIATRLVTVLGKRHRHFVQDHVSFFSAETLSAMMERCGLRVKEVYYPRRSLSIGHFAWWLGQYGFPDRWVARLLPSGVGEKSVRIGLGDIVTVIGERSQESTT